MHMPTEKHLYATYFNIRKLSFNIPTTLGAGPNGNYTPTLKMILFILLIMPACCFDIRDGVRA
jgi:hypothetical protein